LRSGDSASLVTDFPSIPTAQAFGESLRVAGVRLRVLVLPSGEPLDRAALEFVRSGSSTFFLTQHPPVTPEELLRSNRLVDLSGLHAEQIERLFSVPPTDLERPQRELQGYFASGGRAQITSENGTQFEFAIDRAAEPLFRLPPGLICILPKPASGRGTLVVDAAITGIGRPEPPVTFRFDGGLLLDASDSALQEVLTRLGENARRLCAISIGLNPNARPSGAPAEESLVPGRLTLYLGSGAWIGGAIQAPSRMRLCLASATLTVDARRVPTELLPSPAPIAPPPLPSLPGSSDVFRNVFDNANEAQYLLDLETEVFLEVNPAFVKLVGYTRDELVNKMTARQLLPPEGEESHARRRAERPSRPVERYELRILPRDKNVRLVDVNVRLVQIAGRPVVIGSMRDITEQKRLQEGNWAKIEEILASNARIGILKEKLERVQEFAAKLYNLRDETQIFKEAAAFMLDRAKLAYTEASFYVIRGDSLQLTHSSSGTAPLSFGLSEVEGIARVLVGDDKVQLEGDRLTAALKGLDQNLGILQARLPAKELEALRESPAASKSYLNIFGTLANILGLSIENVRLYNRVFKESIHDALTQTYNRRFLDAKLEEEVRRAERYGRPLSIIMIDLNDFKQVNDHHSHRHRQGDVLLKEIAAVIKSSSREVDIVARYGGDEFIVVMPETPRDGAAKKAIALQKLVFDTPYTDLETGKKSLRLSCAVGVSGVEHRALPSSPGELVREADQAMYQDKARTKSKGEKR